MSNFYCEHCGALCEDSEMGYVSGCEHYPPDVRKTRPQTEEEIILAIKAGRIIDGRKGNE